VVDDCEGVGGQDSSVAENIAGLGGVVERPRLRNLDHERFFGTAVHAAQGGAAVVHERYGDLRRAADVRRRGEGQGA
jgi:hypothetical protein